MLVSRCRSLHRVEKVIISDVLTCASELERTPVVDVDALMGSCARVMESGREGVRAASVGGV